MLHLQRLRDLGMSAGEIVMAMERRLPVRQLPAALSCPSIVK
jgi:hypothetical protein